MSAPLCFIDSETDGIHPRRKAWDIAIIRRDDDGTDTDWQAFLSIDLSTADPFALDVGRFYQRHPQGRHLSSRSATHPGVPLRHTISPAHAAAKIAQLTHGAHIVGAVPNFDTEVLERLLRGHGYLPKWHYHLVDIENLAVGYLAAHPTATNDEKQQLLQPPWSSDALSRALGIPPMPDDDRHTALGDARWARAIYDRILNPERANA